MLRIASPLLASLFSPVEGPQHGTLGIHTDVSSDRSIYDGASALAPNDFDNPRLAIY